jgi:hypothetical protein
MSPRLRRLAWFAALYLASLAVALAAAFLLRGLLPHG